jgi:hypothetical protein
VCVCFNNKLFNGVKRIFSNNVYLFYSLFVISKLFSYILLTEYQYSIMACDAHHLIPSSCVDSSVV